MPRAKSPSGPNFPKQRLAVSSPVSFPFALPFPVLCLSELLDRVHSLSLSFSYIHSFCTHSRFNLVQATHTYSDPVQIASSFRFSHCTHIPDTGARTATVVPASVFAVLGECLKGEVSATDANIDQWSRPLFNFFLLLDLFGPRTALSPLPAELIHASISSLQRK